MSEPAMTHLRWGIIGIGNIVQTTIAPAMTLAASCEIVAAVSRDQERANAFAREFEVPFAYTDYNNMLANPDVDAIFIATPNNQHGSQVVAAARAGKHVLCDKPLATEVSVAREAIAECAEAGVRLGINFHNRMLPWVKDTKALIAAGTIGDVVSVEAMVGSGHRHYTNWRADPKMAGMGSVYNVGVHVFDLLAWVLDAEPVEVMAMFDNDPSQGGVEMLAMTTVRFDNGALAQVNSNELIDDPRNDVVIYGTKGRIVANNLTRARVDGTLEVRTPQGEIITAYPAPEAHRLSVEAFTDAVLSGRTPDPSGRDGLASMLLCDAIARSVNERRLVQVAS